MRSRTERSLFSPTTTSPAACSKSTAGSGFEHHAILRLGKFECPMSEPQKIEREVMQYDLVVVGAGPAGLAFAIRLKQLKPEKTICVLEKASSIGAHSLSGAVIEPGPLEKLLPNWRAEYTGMKVPAVVDDLRFMSREGSTQFPPWLVKLAPKYMLRNTPLNNHGNFIVSLGQLTPYLAKHAEALGVDVFPGYAAAAPVYDDAG